MFGKDGLVPLDVIRPTCGVAAFRASIGDTYDHVRPRRRTFPEGVGKNHHDGGDLRNSVFQVSFESVRAAAHPATEARRQKSMHARIGETRYATQNEQSSCQMCAGPVSFVRSLSLPSEEATWRLASRKVGSGKG